MISSKKLCVRMCWCMMKYGWCVTFLLIKRRENSNIQFFFIYFLHAIFSLWSWQGHGESRILIDPCQNLIMMTTIYKKILFQRICNKYGGKNEKQKEKQANTWGSITLVRAGEAGAGGGGTTCNKILKCSNVHNYSTVQIFKM